MHQDKAIDILKNAILLEKRGHAFYSQVARQATGPTVKEFFEMLADEEVKHIRILTDQAQAYKTNNAFNPGDFDENRYGAVAADVLNAQLKKEISAAQYEAAAISALRHSLAFKDARLSALGSSPRQVADYTNTRIKRYSGLWDPTFDKNFAAAAQTVDPAKRSKMFKDLALELIWDNDMVMIPAPKALTVWWPWLKNYYGENNFGYQNIVPALSRMWIDKGLKKDMGF